MGEWVRAWVCVCVCLHDPGSGLAMFKEPFVLVKHPSLGISGCMALLFGTVPEVLRTPPSEPVRLGSDFIGYGTDRLACHYLGVNYKVAFVAERSSVKDTL